MKIIGFSIEEESDMVLGMLRKSGVVEVKVRLMSQGEDDMPPQGDARNLRAMRSWVAEQLLADE